MKDLDEILRDHGYAEGTIKGYMRTLRLWQSEGHIEIGYALDEEIGMFCETHGKRHKSGLRTMRRLVLEQSWTLMTSPADKVAAPTIPEVDQPESEPLPPLRLVEQMEETRGIMADSRAEFVPERNRTMQALAVGALVLLAIAVAITLGFIV